LTVAQLSSAAGIHRSYISKLEQGTTLNPSAEIAKRLSNGLKVDHEWLIWGKGNPVPLHDPPEATVEVSLAGMAAVFEIISRRISRVEAAKILSDLFDHMELEGNPARKAAMDAMYARAMRVD
jgi:transcriptional regulator with XRE-family HTH domain